MILEYVRISVTFACVHLCTPAIWVANEREVLNKDNRIAGAFYEKPSEAVTNAVTSCLAVMKQNH